MSLGGNRPHIPVSIRNKMDCFSSKQRSVVMSKIRSTNTRQELLAIRWFSERDYAFDSHRKDMPGTPDIVFEMSLLTLFLIFGTQYDLFVLGNVARVQFL